MAANFQVYDVDCLVNTYYKQQDEKIGEVKQWKSIMRKQKKEIDAREASIKDANKISESNHSAPECGTLI